MTDLARPLAELSGVGAKTVGLLSKMGLETVRDLIHHYPRRYDDFSKVVKVANSKPGTITVQGEITRVMSRRTQRGRQVTEALITDDSGTLKAVWFNQPYLKRGLPTDVPVFVSGLLEFKYNQYALQNPVVERVSSFPKDTARIVPVYPETAGLSSKQLRGLLRQVLPISVVDAVPEAIRRTFKLSTKSEALSELHFPSSAEKLAAARYRLGFEEVYLLLLMTRFIKSELSHESAAGIPFDENLAQKFIKNLPYMLTDSQRKAAWVIVRNLGETHPMNRLLQGDVGSGKTVVAVLAALLVARAGLQTVLLAPTEILSRQHYQTFKEFLDIFKVKTALLAGRMKTAERTATLADIKDGTAQIIIGTHALLEPIVKFDGIGLVIVDEQHRFGVNQRNILKQKSAKSPHFLSMSATPIPRSLALTVYGDLDISSITELPPARKPVITEVVTNARATYRQILTLVTNGSQLYVVCPLISESDILGVTSVEQELRSLRQYFPGRRLSGLHGRMKPTEKDVIMQQFREGVVDVLVATTVVEVGVDVSNANVILIEGAERFGLATLHQLRGRVGRGAEQAYCFLKTTGSGQVKQRLKLLEQHHDGFTLAEWDLRLRGSGELYGQRQHGIADLRIARISDTNLIEAARSAVSKTAADISRYPELKQAVAELYARTNPN